MSANPRADLLQLARMLEQAAAALRDLEPRLSNADAEIYCAQLERASHAFGEAMETAEALLVVWERPTAN